MLLVEWMEQSVPAWMRIMVIYVTSVLSPRCEYLMEIRAHCMFLYLCRESGDKSTPPPPRTALAFPTSDDTVVFTSCTSFLGVWVRVHRSQVLTL